MLNAICISMDTLIKGATERLLNRSVWGVPPAGAAITNFLKNTIAWLLLRWLLKKRKVDMGIHSLLCNADHVDTGIWPRSLPGGSVCFAQTVRYSSKTSIAPGKKHSEQRIICVRRKKYNCFRINVRMGVDGIWLKRSEKRKTKSEKWKGAKEAEGAKEAKVKKAKAKDEAEAKHENSLNRK